MEVYKPSIPRHKRNLFNLCDLDCFRNYIMFLVEKPSMLNIIARKTMEQRILEGTISMMNLLDKQSFDNGERKNMFLEDFCNIRIN